MHDETHYRDLKSALSAYAAATKTPGANLKALVAEGHDFSLDAAKAIGELLLALELAQKVSIAHGADPSFYELVGAKAVTPARVPDNIIAAVGELDRALEICRRARQHIHDHYLPGRTKAINEEKGFSLDLINTEMFRDERTALLIFVSRAGELIGELMNESVDLK